MAMLGTIGVSMYFAYDAAGRPVSVEYNGTTYLYLLNAQGDVIMIINPAGNQEVSYTYDAWGRVLSTTGNLASTLGVHNSLRYRGYVYDTDTGLYYLQSRYYNPEMGRFLNADSYASTGQGILGNNMFAYCNNNPIKYMDSAGCYPLQIAFEFLACWLNGDGSEQVYSGRDRLVRKLKKSKMMQSYIENYQHGQTSTSGSGEFTADSDGYELYLSTQHFDYTVEVTSETRTVGFWFWKHQETRYTATVTVHDTYNFDSFRSWDSFGNIMNNLAYSYDILIGGNDFEWFATYTYSTKWTDVA